MQKIFQEYGGVITVAVAIVALVGIVGMLLGNGGFMTGAFNDVVDKFEDKVGTAIEEHVDSSDGGAESLVLLDGDGSVLDKTTPTLLSFRSSGNFENFSGVKIDGQLVDTDAYLVTEGSTIVTFTDAYSSMLSDGDHTIEIVSTNGAASGGFKVIDGTTTIPEGATYYVGVTSSAFGDYTGGTALAAGDEFPDTVNDGDIFVYGDYEYKYNYWYNPYKKTWSTRTSNWIKGENGWGVTVRDRTATSYGDILTSINGAKVIDMHATFRYCSNMTTSPAIPDTVLDLDGAFADCTSLKTAPIVLDSVRSITNAYINCTALEFVPNLPASAYNFTGTFKNCTSLKTVPEFPANLHSDTSILGMFQGCTALETAPVIPAEVYDMSSTFSGCTALTGNIEINAVLGSPLGGSETAGCFKFTVKPIHIIGSCSDEMKAELAATATNGNVTY